MAKKNNKADSAPPSARRVGAAIRKIYDRLLEHYGPRHWWPAQSEDELVIGVVLTQNCAWTNVEKALANLREKNACDLATILALDDARVAECIRPAGYYNLKTRRLKAVARFFVEEWGRDWDALRARDTDSLRRDLLAVYGLGPESVDSILVYLLEKPSFVIDAYTFRIIRRHGLIDDAANYEAARALLERHLPRDAALFNEYHAMIVHTSKDYCRPRAPRCAECPLNQSRLFLDPERRPTESQ